MAKWGEGDPRWIVEERPDATNVNNWHWSEKNASDWSKAKLNTLFKNSSVEAPGLGMVTITDVSKCEGEAIVNNRKGKLIFFYEWAIILDWKASPDDDSDDDEAGDIEGSIEILNLSEENQPHEIDISVMLKKGGSKGEKFKEFLRLTGADHIKEKVGQYIESLKVEYAPDLILPTKNQPQAVMKHNKTIVTQELANNIKNISVSSPSSKAAGKDGVSFRTTDIHLTQYFKCTAEDFYKALTVREMVCAFTRNDVKLETRVGGAFELFGGSVLGEFAVLRPNEEVAQRWRFRTWPEGHYSEVVFRITQEEERTRVDLTQTRVPVNDVERTRQGWHKYYWDAMKRTFGFGAELL